MAQIKHWGLGGGNGIEAYTPKDIYYYEIDNRPLFNLTRNDEKINDELESMVYKTPVEHAEGKTNGVLNEFTLPNGEKAIAGSLSVYLNGVVYNPKHIILLEGNFKFKIINDILPTSYDEFYVMYRKLNFQPSSNSSETIFTDDNLIINVIQP